MNIMNKLTEAIDLLNEVDEYGSSLVSKLSELDSKEQDLLHYIENNKICVLWCYRMIRQLKNLREERRKVKHDMEMLSKFNEIKVRITSKDNRQFILTELYKKEKQLHTTYKNRQYSEDDIQKILKGDKNEK